MIDHQMYDLSSPAEHRAADWAETHFSFFPLTNWSLAGSQASRKNTQLNITAVEQEQITMELLLLTTGQRHSLSVSADIASSGEIEIVFDYETGASKQVREWVARKVCFRE